MQNKYFFRLQRINKSNNNVEYYYISKEENVGKYLKLNSFKLVEKYEGVHSYISNKYRLNIEKINFLDKER